MASEFLKDTAKALVYVSGANFDMFAYDATDLSEDEKRELQKEIEKFCESGLKRLEKKYGIYIPRTSTADVVDSIMYE